VATALLAAPAVSAPPVDPRPELEAVQRALDRAVGAVSRAAMADAFGAPASRGYHVAGQGAVFVLSARGVPLRPRRHALLRGPDAEAFERGLQTLEAGLLRIDSPEIRRQMETALEELRRTQQSRERAVEAARAGLRAAQENERQARREVNETRRQFDGQAQRDAELKELLSRAEAYQREASRAREAAELALRKALEEARSALHVRVEAEGPVSPGRPAPPPAPDAPVPPPPPDPALPASAPVPAADVLPPVPDVAPPAPPWSFWFDLDEEEDPRSADEVVHSVREAVVSTLEMHGARLKSVRPEESVTVAVDFVPRGPFVLHRRPARTLVIRVRKEHIDDRLAGKLGPEDFQARVEATEY
jgi:hypothetical protein